MRISDWSSDVCSSDLFDVVRIENSSIRNLKIDLTYAWSDRTIWGIDGVGANQQAVSGDNVFANVAYKTPVGTLTGFAYLADQDETAVLAKSSQPYVARFAGAHPLTNAVKLSYSASYRSEEHTSKLHSRMRISYAAIC